LSLLSPELLVEEEEEEQEEEDSLEEDIPDRGGILGEGGKDGQRGWQLGGGSSCWLWRSMIPLEDSLVY
jgi:hypothetical protein